MPLPGGPSDKVGNRYELRWIVRQLLDLVTGRLEWLRVEPPGENSIEFRSGSSHSEEAHQVKRGLAGGGHWTIAALREVLDGFGTLLGHDRELRCTFSSEHSAPELQELSDRARGARDLTEFLGCFLGAHWIEKSWQQLQTIWGTDAAETWHRLRRITVTSVSEQHLRENTDVILQLLFDAPPPTSRAVLMELALEAVHQELRRPQILSRLAERGIRPFTTAATNTIAPRTSAPPAQGIRRSSELEEIAGFVASGKTVFVGGITGIGKTTVATQFAEEWKGPVCWIDCGLITTELEALSAIAEFALKVLGDDVIATAVSGGSSRTKSLAQLAGRCLAARRCLLVWDGVDGDLENTLRPTIDALSMTINGGAQLVTAQGHEFGRGGTFGSVHIGRLDPVGVRRLFVDAFPDSRVPDLEAADDLTQGHPYLVQLLIGAASTLDLKTALQTIPKGTGPDFLVSQVLSGLPGTHRTLLTNLAWLGIPFSAPHVSRLGGVPEMLRDLAARYLILRVGGDVYRVHEIVATLIKRSTGADSLEFHQRAALFLRGLEQPSWLEVRATLIHARAASMSDIAAQAGSALLRYAMDSGRWTLAREAAESLIQNSAGVQLFYPHFVLGKLSRVTDDLGSALDHYRAAEAHAIDPKSREIARYEQASVLCGLDKRAEADVMYAELAHSTAAETRVEARIALAMGMSERGEVLAAVEVLKDAAAIASKAELRREEAEAWQGLAEVFSRAERWKDARRSIKKAHELRFVGSDEQARDIFGWYHLYASALRIERALDNKDGARSAARGLWRVSVLSGSVKWEANAAHVMCLTNPDVDDSEIKVAVSRLRTMGGDSTQSPASRLVALESLVLCEWSLHRYEPAIEAIAEVAALAEESGIRPSFFGHTATTSADGENIAAMPGGYLLLLPPGEKEQFVVDTATRIFERRPELAKYSVAVIGRLRSDAQSNRGRRKTRRRAKKSALDGDVS